MEPNNSLEVKTAQTVNPVLDLIKKRWSARSFSPKRLTETDIETILEGASWAPSANNEQPWLFLVAERGSDRFEKIWNSLMPGNQPWAKNAGAFVVSIARPEFLATGKPNAYSEHDLGLANGFLILQARSISVFSHIMAGFDKAKLAESLELAPSLKPMCVIALGYLDKAEKLEETFKVRELTPRTRKPISEIRL